MNIDITQEGNVVEENLPYALNFMIKRVTSTVNVPMAVPLKKHVQFKRSVKTLYDLIDRLLVERRTSGQDSGDLLSMLMRSVDSETGVGMSDQQLKDEILTFFLAGHETSAVALSWALHLLVSNPTELEKVRAEVNSVVGKGEITMHHLRQLPYTQQVIKETMRLISPIWVLGREALSDDQLGSYRIKKGDSIIFSPYLVHRHPAFWDDPDAFRPERFSPENESSRHKFAYFPFGGGPRLCIGSSFALMEMQLILATLIRTFSFTPQSDSDPGYNYSLTLRPASEIMMHVRMISE